MELWLAKSIALRKLGRMSYYTDLSESDKRLGEFPFADDISLQDEETVLGFYALPGDALQPIILVTNCGLHIGFETGWLMVNYNDIVRTHGPETKQEISGVMV